MHSLLKTMVKAGYSRKRYAWPITASAMTIAPNNLNLSLLASAPRFYDWQLAQTTEESWRECHLHARNLLGELGYRQLIESTDNPHLREQKIEKNLLPKVAEEPAIYNKDTPDSKRGKETGQSDMFK